jgi:4'-phosphopantetheinyl transferase
VVEELSPDDLRVWYQFTEALSSAEIAALEPILSAAERERAARFVFARDRRDYVAAHALLRRSLSRYGRVSPEAWQFMAAADGKPMIAAGQQTGSLTFSLSHTRGLVACAVAVSAEIGLDVEAVNDSQDRGLVAQHFARSERRLLATVPPAQRAARFTELWTLKESYLKAVGLGLRHPLDAFAFSFEADRIGFEGPNGAEGTWYFALAEPTPAFRLAVAARWGIPFERCRPIVQDIDARATAPLPLTRDSGLLPM